MYNLLDQIWWRQKRNELKLKKLFKIFWLILKKAWEASKFEQKFYKFRYKSDRLWWKYEKFWEVTLKNCQVLLRFHMKEWLSPLFIKMFWKLTDFWNLANCLTVFKTIWQLEVKLDLRFQILQKVRKLWQT